MTPKDYRYLLRAFLINAILIVVSGLCPSPTLFSVLFAIEVGMAIFIIAGALIDGDYLLGRKDE